MKNISICFVLFSLSVLTSCGTGYQKHGYSGGYSEKKISSTVFWLQYAGNGYTSNPQAADYWNRRANELCMSDDYESSMKTSYENKSENSHPKASGYLYCNSLITDTRLAQSDAEFYESMELSFEPVAPVRDALLDLFREQKYSLVESFLSNLRRAYIETPNQYENDYHAAIQVFELFDISDLYLFDEWVKSSPESDLPYLARAVFFLQQAWNVRGNQYSENTASEKFKGMKEFLSLAESDIDVSIEKDTSTYWPLLYKIKILQPVRGNVAEIEELVKKANNMFVDNTYVRAAYLNILQPKWYGSISQMEEFITSQKEIIVSNPRLSWMNGYMSQYRAWSLISSQQYREALIFANRALEHGSLPSFYHARVAALQNLGNHEDALDGLKAMTVLRPYSARYARWYAKSLAKNGFWSEAVTQFDKGVYLSPLDGYLRADRGDLFYDLRLYELAVEDLSLAIELGRNHPYNRHKFKSALFQLNARKNIPSKASPNNT